jgi:sterol desaturase/sphingolipid hydroxylase (fatty acid hydroxylase superfamily)
MPAHYTRLHRSKLWIHLVQDFLKSDLSLFALPLYIAAVALEAWWSRKRGLTWYRGADLRASLAMGVLSILVEVLPRLLALFVMVKLYDISPLRDVVGHQWWAWVLLFFLDDFSYYWFHRSNHEVRYLLLAPGWSHDGPDKRARTLRRKLG